MFEEKEFSDEVKPGLVMTKSVSLPAQCLPAIRLSSITLQHLSLNYEECGGSFLDVCHIAICSTLFLHVALYWRLDPCCINVLGCFQLCFRENDLVALPKEIGDLVRLRELHIQGNRLTVLPPEFGMLWCVWMGDKNT